MSKETFAAGLQDDASCFVAYAGRYLRTEFQRLEVPHHVAGFPFGHVSDEAYRLLLESENRMLTLTSGFLAGFAPDTNPLIT